MGKKKLAPLSLFLAILLITCCEMVEEVGAKLVCKIYWPLCIEKCYKSGKCMRCCKNWGFVHGRCNPLRGMGCYCCADDSDPGDAALRRRYQYHQQQKMVAPPPES
uniref:Knottin scorpion toxin-like domain-containing protein n=1 Tax=Aegilops tauschii TaxID=37682 RepID=R7VZT4_AEGTA